MGKFGVGVGDEFPVDEPKRKEETPDSQGSHPDSSADRHKRHREWHRRWREEARKRGSRGSSRDWHHYAVPPLWRSLFIIGGIAMLIAIITHFFYFILGAAVLAVLTIIHHNHRDDAMWDLYPNTPPSADTQ
jgi:hypothetical protein